MLHRYRQLCSIQKRRLERPLRRGKIRKVIGLIKNEFDGKKNGGVAALKPKVYNYLIDDCEENKKTKGKKRVCQITYT